MATTYCPDRVLSAQTYVSLSVGYSPGVETDIRCCFSILKVVVAVALFSYLHLLLPDADDVNLSDIGLSVASPLEWFTAADTIVYALL